MNADFAAYRIRGTRPGPAIALIGGVHGNEPAGTVALLALVRNPPRLRRGTLIVIPAANPWGLRHNSRYQADGSDLNRAFNPPVGAAARLARILRECDLVVDFHEGWSWHVRNPLSIGSTISATGAAREWALDIIAGLNRFTPRGRHFVLERHPACDIPSSLECFMRRAGRAYMLVETTGQKNIQPLSVRVRQINYVISRVIAPLLNQ